MSRGPSFRRADQVVLEVIGIQQKSGLPLAAYSPARMTSDLRRLRPHGLIKRIPQSHRYRVTDSGLRVALFFTKVHSRILRPGLSQLFDGCLKAPNRTIATAMGRLHHALEDQFEQAKLAPT
jgi:Mn-dependent DtxR family transcriptional regulator